jgi:hypothetical protein
MAYNNNIKIEAEQSSSIYRGERGNNDCRASSDLPSLRPEYVQAVGGKTFV